MCSHLDFHDYQRDQKIIGSPSTTKQFSAIRSQGQTGRVALRLSISGKPVIIFYDDIFS